MVTSIAKLQQQTTHKRVYSVNLVTTLVQFIYSPNYIIDINNITQYSLIIEEISLLPEK